MPESTYSVYLVQRHGEQGGQREVTSPVRGRELDFYETGVWLTRETGRNFFPYEQIRTIREHPAEGSDAEGRDAEERDADEQTAESGGPGDGGGASDGDEPGESTGGEPGDPGAEEEMLE